MPFQKNNKLGAKKIVKGELDQLPICFKGTAGQKEKLKTIPDWQEQLREFVDVLIADVENLDKFD